MRLHDAGPPCGGRLDRGVPGGGGTGRGLKRQRFFDGRHRRQRGGGEDESVGSSLRWVRPHGHLRRLRRGRGCIENTGFKQGGDLERSGPRLQPLRRQLPEPYRRLSRRPLRTGMGRPSGPSLRPPRAYRESRARRTSSKGSMGTSTSTGRTSSKGRRSSPVSAHNSGWKRWSTRNIPAAPSHRGPRTRR